MACHSKNVFDEVIPTLPESVKCVKHLFERGELKLWSGEKQILPIVINDHMK